MGDLSIRAAQIRPYKLSLSGTARARYGAHREGRLVSLTASSGIRGWGDAAPLPGFSLDSVDDIDQSWPKVMSRLDGLSQDPSDICRDLPRALVFALEQAVFAIRGRMLGLQPANLLCSEYRRRIRVSGLVDCGPEEAAAQSRRLSSGGCRSLKLKVGRWDVANGPKAVAEIRNTCGPGVDIHLDANRSWSVGQAVEFLEAVDDLEISYVEEPLMEPDRLEELTERTSIPLALDESLVDVEPGELEQRLSFAEFAVIKPTVMGGIRRSFEFARAAGAAGMTAVISSSVESGLSLLWLIAMAACPKFAETAGLDTYRYLASDVLSPRLNLGWDADVALAARVYDPFEVP